MKEIKKVVVLNNEIINVGEMDNIPEGATIEEREMEYTEEHGWREVDWIPPMAPEEEIAQLKAEKEELAQTLDMVLTELLPDIAGGEKL